MNKQEIYDFLNRKGVSYEVTEHEAVFNMAELDSVELPYPDRDAKNLFVRDDKKRNYYLIPGAVTPLGLLNDEDHKVTLYLDSAFIGGLIGVHPNDNTATVWLKAEDLIRIIKESSWTRSSSAESFAIIAA